MSFDLGPALLFCPADRPDRYRKAADRADAVILDLEDALLPANRARARGLLVGHPLDPNRTIVRVNPVGTPDFALDLDALDETMYRYVMVPKTVSAAELEALARFEVIALCETATGVLAAPSIAAAPNVVALMWGADDLVASLGGSSSRFADGSYRAVARHARSAVLLAAGAHGKAAVDGVFLAIPDLAGLTAEVDDAVASGFRATACIHPSQVGVIRDAYRPAPAEVAAAWAILEAAAGEEGVFAYQGRMVDAPLLRHAEAVLRRAEVIPPGLDQPPTEATD
ncbi:CoA ester lyase [Cryobacterium sp. TMT1-21]|uniref:CoA ester lyase n=1 Tax=Cryobacterium shii TaxID=1259235 RepID=A0AAQ2C568_9MICO|nr:MULTISPECIES: CoA ester lyase [Cryobacterium]TFC43820.1 CoA ester lyase [Cryobacterium shii]TFD14013.1 CoA ester lyase [Cryobacterium sp. TMT1-21]TFD16315.1 CoA ester lyase [Cryobacterium sp. TMT4-10]TFD27398.1 CoA ester lyase [Cryobacterium sp. TMT2-23]TFD40240.1 CoA ester lyase [Cryobacterium sp. TMT2-10]